MQKIRSLEKYIELNDRLNAPVLLEDDKTIKPLDKPYAFIQPDSISINNITTNEFTLQISNAGTGFLILFDILSDVDWINIDDNNEKKVLEWHDDPIMLKVKIEIDKLTIGENNGTITIQTAQDEKNIHHIPVKINIPKEDASIIIASTNIIDFGSVPLYKEHEFIFNDTSADQVYLQGDFTNWELGKIQMKKQGNKYSSYIPLDDGEYLYQFIVDDRELPDPNNQQNIIIGEHGNCSRIILNRYKRSFSLTNNGTKSLKVNLNSMEGINLSEYEFWLDKGENKKIDVFLLPHLMKIGINSYNIDIKLKSRQVGNVIVKAKGIAYGPISSISTMELSLGDVFRGSEILARLKIRNDGQGTLKVNIIAEVPWLKSQKIDLAEAVESEIPLIVDSKNLEHGEYRTTITLLTNDYIYNKDKYYIPLDFRLISMDIEPKVVDFGVLYVGEQKEISIRAKRSDGAKIELEFPQDLPSWLDATNQGRQSLSFKINWDRIFLESDQDIYTIINIFDRRSQLAESITIKGRILIPHIAVEEIFLGKEKWKSKTLPLIIKNIGNGKLVINKIEIDEEYKWLTISLKKKKKSPPMFFVTINKHRIPKDAQNTVLKGIIRIYSNDPIEPVLNSYVNIEA